MQHQEIVTEPAIAIVMAVMDATAIVIVIVIVIVVVMKTVAVIVNKVRTITDGTVSFTNPHYRQM